METKKNLSANILYSPYRVVCTFLILIAIIIIQFSVIISMYRVLYLLNERIELMECTIEACFRVYDNVPKDTWDNNSARFDVRNLPR